MAEEEKYRGVLKAQKAAEHEAIQERNTILAVLENRQSVIAELEAAEQGILGRLKQVATENRSALLSTGEIHRFTAGRAYEERLKAQLQELEHELQEKRISLERARERTKNAEQEVLDARVEKKKIEQLQSSHTRLRSVSKAALEEAETDERSKGPKR